MKQQITHIQYIHTRSQEHGVERNYISSSPLITAFLYCARGREGGILGLIARTMTLIAEESLAFNIHNLHSQRLKTCLPSWISEWVNNKINPYPWLTMRTSGAVTTTEDDVFDWCEILKANTGTSGSGYNSSFFIDSPHPENSYCHATVPITKQAEKHRPTV